MAMFVQGSPEWLKERATVISSTECSAFELVNPWNKPMEIVRQKVRALSGEPSEFKTNPAVKHGTKTEPLARAWYEKETGEQVIETGMVRHPEHSFLGASPDGLVGMDGMVEIKCPFGKKTYSIFDSDKKHYLWQVYMAMECLDVDWCDFVCYLQKDPSKPPVVKVERVQRKTKWLQEKVSAELLSQPREGTVERQSLYHNWFNYINDQYQQGGLRQAHIAPLPDKTFKNIEDEQMTELAKVVKRIQEIKKRNEDDLSALETLVTQKEDLKKEIADRHKVSVTNGLVQIKVVSSTPPVDYKAVYEFLGGDAALKAKGKELDSFRKQTSTHRATVIED